MLRGECRCGIIRFRLRSPLKVRVRCQRRTGRSTGLPTLLVAPPGALKVKNGAEWLDTCGEWRLCRRCGTPLYSQGESEVAALASAIVWPEHNVESLHDAARFNNISEVRKLLHRNVPLEAKIQGWTPLAWAASAGMILTCRELLRHGARVEEALGPAAFARTATTPRILRLLLRYGAEPQTLFQQVAEGGSVRDARVLLKAGVDVNARSAEGYTPLSGAAFNSVAMIRFLLRLGADAHALVEDERSVLELCAIKGRTKSLETLLQSSPSQSELDGALMGACHAGEVACVSRLLQAGARPDAFDSAALAAASHQGSLIIVEMLLEHGADPSHVYKTGRTALDMARLYVLDLSEALKARLNLTAKDRVRQRWSTNSGGEPVLKLRARGVTTRRTDCHAAIVTRLSTGENNG